MEQSKLTEDYMATLTTMMYLAQANQRERFALSLRFYDMATQLANLEAHSGLASKL